MSLMSEQLLKAGLVTEEQVKKAAEKPKKKVTKKYTNKNNQTNKKKKSAEQSDLEKFYKLRSNEENKIKQEALRKKREAALLKKEMNKKINKLISENTLNAEKADIRYNFVVGTTIKYVFVNAQQQEKLANGELAITFLGGNRCIIPVHIGRKIQAIDPKKILIITELSSDDS